jgi:hypothetical protein
VERANADQTSVRFRAGDQVSQAASVPADRRSPRVGDQAWASISDEGENNNRNKPC